MPDFLTITISQVVLLLWLRRRGDLSSAWTLPEIVLMPALGNGTACLLWLAGRAAWVMAVRHA